MLKALVPVDGSTNSLVAVRHVMLLVKGRERLEIHLLNVQPPVHGDVAMFVSGSAIGQFHEEAADKAVAAACRMLDDDDVPYARHVAVGHTAPTIAAWAGKLRCDKVVMGTRGLGTMSQLLLGSVTNAVIHHVDPHIPVTLVKDRIRTHLPQDHR
jgi:nucleotide-binding universal stress UspA family protein